MNMLPIPRPGRKRLALAAGAVAIAALTIVGGADAASAASAPAPKPGAHTTGEAPIVVAVNCAPDQGGVKLGKAKPLPNQPVVDDASGPTLVAVDCDPELVEAGGPHSQPPQPPTGTDKQTVVEVSGAVPDLKHVLPGKATKVNAAPRPIGGGGKTTTKH